jgi:triosephosphate isomerase
MSNRLPLVVANWKLNGDLELLDNLATKLNELDSAKVETVICPPFVYLGADSQGIKKGAQTIALQEKGAFTGEVSGRMLRDVGCQYVIVGHSERRTLFGESDDVVAAKTLATLNAGLVPIICVGESEAERESGETMNRITEQVKVIMEVLPSFADSIVFAYEPIWAIGTGKTASCEQAEEVHKHIRQVLAGFNHEMADTTRILYGGSVNPENSAELFASENIDGGLIGGASLDAESFTTICTNAVA